MTKFRLAVLGLAAAAGFSLSASAALAVDAIASSAVNVRTGPDTTYAIVDQLYKNEPVDITQCVASNWCYIQHDGPDGWVSAQFLAAPNSSPPPPPPGPPGNGNQDCSFGFSVGPNGPNLNINCGNGPVPPGPPGPPSPPPLPPPMATQACFFTGHNFNGQSFCQGPGTINALNGAFNDRISSVQLQGGAKARLCVNNNLGGYCRNVFSDTTLGPLIDDKASSLVVFTGAPPSPPPSLPVTYSSGAINLPQTFTADLDSGSVGGAGSDIWYQAINPFNKRITPQNGAVLAIGDGSGYAGCSVASYSGSPLPLASIPPGTYVCVKTDQGRISQFRVNGFSGTRMNMGYTTWAN